MVSTSEFKEFTFDEVFMRVAASGKKLQTAEYQKFGTFPIVDQGQKLVVAFTDNAQRLQIPPDDGYVIFGDHTRIVKFVSFPFVIGADGVQILKSRSGFSAQYLAAFLSSLSIPSTGYNRHYKFLKDLSFYCPPFKEQVEIVNALSNAVALVESLDALITKKRDMKQAAMQQLLTGHTRLPGFTEAWTEIAYNEITWHKAGNGSLIKGKVYQDSGMDRVPAFSASGQDVWCEVAEYFEPGLVISAVGSRCGKVFRANGSWTAIANTHVLFAEKSRCDIDFLWLRVNEEKFWVKGGTGQPFVLVRETLKRRDLWPAVDEQAAIARVLLDMEAEISALVAQREKAELVKLGMMQELLSGRVRLV
jgi:hypothetical protein